MTVTGHEYHATRVRGLAAWNPKPATLQVVDQINAVIAEYRAYLPLTARQVFYRLVGNHGYDKTEKAYKRLLEYLNRGRRAGMIRWSAIRDDGFDQTGGGGWDDAADYLRFVINDAQRYRRDRQQNQEWRVEVWVEAAGMMPQAARAVREYSVPVFSSGGFNSTTAKHETAQRISSRYNDSGQRTVILHVGDYDPSGVAIIDSLAADIWTFLEDLGLPDIASFERIAVTPAQIDELGLPGAPPKATDRRSGFDDLAVQAESIAPDVLSQIIDDATADMFDLDEYQSQLDLEAEEREELIDRLATLRDDL